jgi:ribose transport system ATP-binding protein
MGSRARPFVENVALEQDSRNIVRHAADRPPFLEIEQLSKHYGGIQALGDVSLSVWSGTVHALVGANGAGKSTLVRILAGLERPDTGTIRIDGEAASIQAPEEATKLGLSFIHQELHLVPKFNTIQNMALGYEGARRAGMVNWGPISSRARVVMDRLGVEFPLDVEVEKLTVNERWMVSLGRALVRDARLIAMDEPTASFTAQEAERLFKLVRNLAADGVAVLYISHRLDEVLDLSSEITVLRNGIIAGRHKASETTRRELTEAIVGRGVPEPVRHHVVADEADTVLELEHLVHEPMVKDVSLSLRRGEILGVAGLVGSGRTELARLIFGAEQSSSGRMMLNGHPYSPRSPYQAIARGVALVPEERRSQGLLLKESVSFNINLATTESNRWHARLPFLSPAKARAAATEMIRSFSIKARSAEQPVSDLSGGNQQKVVVAKYVRAGPGVLILDEPTVGVDVGARAEIYEIIRQRADTGTAVMMISSDFEEFEICDRVVVMREGRVIATVEGSRATKEALTALCYSTTDPS